MHTPYRTVTAILLLTMPVLFACSKAKQPPPRIVPVIAVAAEQQSVPLQIKAIGNVEAVNTVSIKAQASGEISQEDKSGQEHETLRPRTHIQKVATSLA